MTEATTIEWCDSTFNPWVGCTKISPACDHCYAEGWAKRSGQVQWGNQPRKRTSAQNWNEPRRWQRQAAQFFAEHGRRRRVFCASLADVFDNQVPAEWRDDLWALIHETPDIDWLLLTKRPQNIVKMLPASWNDVKHNVWLGTTAEDQKRMDENAAHLAWIDPAVRFVSIEPMLGPVTVSPIFRWVIAGGESGPGARPSHPDWFRSLRDQCAANKVPFLFKQWGEWCPRGPASMGYPPVDGVPQRRITDRGENGQDLASEGGNQVWMNRAGKKLAGRRLDGVEHNGFPEP